MDGIASCYGMEPGDWIPVGGKIFHTNPDLPWDPPSLQYKLYKVGPKGKVARVDHPSSCSATVKKGVELYIYSVSGILWPV